MLFQWYVACMRHHIRAPLRMNEINTLEEALKEAQQMESDVDVTSPSDNGRLKERIEMLHRTIMDMTLHKSNLWCSNCQEEGHTKGTCKHQIVSIIKTYHFYEISREITPHLTKYYPYNLRNHKCRCAIYKESSHNIVDCDLNAKTTQIIELYTT